MARWVTGKGLPVGQLLGPLGGLLLVLLLLSTPATSALTQQPYGPPRFNKIVLVSYDGVSKQSLLESIQMGDSPNAASLIQRGALTDLRMVDHKTSTDPGLAVIETGYGPPVTGIEANYFGAGSEKRVIPDGLTIAERIKARYGDGWKTGLVFPWTFRKNNVTGNEDPIFWNSLADLDYLFTSSNLTWSSSDQVLMKNALSFNGALLRANFTAYMASRFIERYHDRNFYLRTHWAEPDWVGHAANDHYPNGTMTAEYRRALRDVDQALGIILQALRVHGILEETLVLVTTDHGFAGGHGGEGYPFEDPLISVTWLISSHPSIRSPLGWGLMNDIAPSILALAGIDVAGLHPKYSETSGAMPLWLISEDTRDTRPPKILEVKAPGGPLGPGDEFLVSVKAEDESGIREVRLYFRVEGIGFWRSVGSTRVGDLHQATIKSLIPGRAVEWYLMVVDGSPAKNWARHPAQGSLTFSVAPQPSPEGESRTPFLSPDLPLYAILALGLALVALLAIRGRWWRPRPVEEA